MMFYGNIQSGVFWGYYILIAIVERDTRKYHEFIAGYCLRVRSTSKQYPRQ